MTAAPTPTHSPKKDTAAPTPLPTPKPTLPKPPGEDDVYFFTFQGNSFYNHSIETTGWYLLKTLGARGGDIPVDGTIHFFGGFGTLMEGWFNLTKGDVLKIAVGGKGGNGNIVKTYSTCGGGGGSTSIVSEKLGILLVAGAGGGASKRNYNVDANIEQNGHSGNTGGIFCNNAGGAGGVGGGGGGIGQGVCENPQFGGAGGAGYYGDGGTNCGSCVIFGGVNPADCVDGKNDIVSYGGQAFVSGNYGGCCSTDGTCLKCLESNPPCGGFGGGGQGGYSNQNTCSESGPEPKCGGGGGGG